MKKCNEYPEPVRESWAYAQLFRKLGFGPDEISIGVVNTVNAIPEPGPTLNVHLYAQEQSFKIVCSNTLDPGEISDMQSAWEEFCTRANDEFTDSELDEVWEASSANASKVNLVQELINRGFRLPFMAN